MTGLRIPLSKEALLPKEEIVPDVKAAGRFGSCALGKKALYLGGKLFPRIYYIPLDKIDRVFKRLAVSKGAFEGKVFATISYLVVKYSDNKEKVIRFEHEEHLDELLALVKSSTSVTVGKES